MRRAAIVSPDFFEQAERPLRKRGFDVFAVPFSSRVDERIAGHPDLQLFAADGRAFVHPDMPEDFTAVLSRYADITVCSTRLGALYPEDCPYNIAFTGEAALCRRSIIPPEIAAFFDARGIPVIDVPQGYARCSTLVVGGKTIITEDEGIAKAARTAGFDVTVVRPGFIPLKGFKRGFIGGCSGASVSVGVRLCGEVNRGDLMTSPRIGSHHTINLPANEEQPLPESADTDTHTDTVFLSGTLSGHPDWKTMHAKISSRGKKVVELSAFPAEDYGSIMFL